MRVIATRGRENPEVREFCVAPKGEYESPFLKERAKKKEIVELLMAECRAAKLDDRIVERYAGMELVDEERTYYTNTGGELRQRFHYTVPHARMTAPQVK